MTSTVAEIADAQYVMLTTFKKDGTAVASPLWAASDGDGMLLWTVADSWKVKRLRRNSRVLVQACNVNGKKTVGPQVAGIAELVERDVAVDAINRKYGILGRLTTFGSRLRRGADATVGVRVRDA